MQLECVSYLCTYELAPSRAAAATRLFELFTPPHLKTYDYHGSCQKATRFEYAIVQEALQEVTLSDCAG